MSESNHDDVEFVGARFVEYDAQKDGQVNMGQVALGAEPLILIRPDVEELTIEVALSVISLADAAQLFTELGASLHRALAAQVETEAEADDDGGR
jgi:hypothetical protein